MPRSCSTNKSASRPLPSKPMPKGNTALTLPPQGQQYIADTAVAISVTTATWTWVAHVSDVLQLVATIVAIVAGIAAANFHIKKTLAIRDSKDPD